MESLNVLPPPPYSRCFYELTVVCVLPAYEDTNTTVKNASIVPEFNLSIEHYKSIINVFDAACNIMGVFCATHPHVDITKQNWQSEYSIANSIRFKNDPITIQLRIIEYDTLNLIECADITEDIYILHKQQQ